MTSAIAEALDISFYGRRDPQQKLFETLRPQKLLLILDNFELLLDASEWVNEALRVAPNVKILTTSRVKLNLQAENLYPIGGMDYPVDLTYPNDQVLDHVTTSKYSAIQLFIQAARRVRPSFEPTIDDFRQIIQICQRVQGMPLAILLAANWVEMLTLAEIVAEIEKSLDFLEVDLGDIPVRQRSIRAVFEHSWQMLSERERGVFQSLSIFRGGFTRDAARQIVGGSLHDLRAMGNKSLLHRSSTGRYEMHELLRQFAAAKLNELSSTYHAVREKHAAYYASYIQLQEEKLKGSQPQRILVEIETESSNAHLAWNWAVEQQQLARMDQMVDGICFFHLCRMRFQEGNEICTQAIEKLEQVVAGDGLRVLAKIGMWQGMFNRRLGSFEISDQLLKNSLTLLGDPTLENLDTRLEKAAILLQMGHTVFDHNPRKARDLYEQSLAFYRALDDQWGLANALSALSWSAWSGGEYLAAKKTFQETLKIRLSLGDIRGIIDSSAGLGNVEIFLGQFEEAERLMYESVSILQKVDGDSGFSDVQIIAGKDLPSPNELAITTTLYQELVGLYSDLGFSHSLAPSNSILDFILKHLGRYEQARHQAVEGLVLARQIGWRQEEGLTLEVLGEIALAEGAYDEANDYLLESFGILKFTGQIEQYEVLAVLGYVNLGLNQPQKALQYLVEALQLASEIPTYFPIITALTGIALLMAVQGAVERAVELYSLASHYPRVANSHWFEDIAGHRIADLAVDLPPDRVAKAKAQGDAQDLDATVAGLLDEFSNM